MKTTAQPTFSIVIPTYNRPSQLSACLQACARLDYPTDRFEVVVVDDGGTTPLDSVVGQFNGKLTVKLLRQENAGPAGARNFGAFQARGQFLAFTDDDCLPAPNWLRALETQFALTPECAVGGQIFNTLTHNSYSSASQLLISYLSSYYNAVPQKARFFTSNNLAFPTREFRGIGGFDVTYPRAAAEDREICERWLFNGYRMIYEANSVVYHAHDLRFRTFLHQHFHYGQGAFCFHSVRARRWNRIKLEPASFYIKLLFYPFFSGQGRKAPLLTLLLGIAQIANAAGFFWKFAKERMNSALPKP